MVYLSVFFLLFFSDVSRRINSIVFSSVKCVYFNFFVLFQQFVNSNKRKSLNANMKQSSEYFVRLECVRANKCHSIRGFIVLRIWTITFLLAFLLFNSSFLQIVLSSRKDKKFKHNKFLLLLHAVSTCI